MPDFMLNVSTPERQFYNGPVEALRIRSTQGEIGVLPGHVSMVVALDAAPMHIKADGEWKAAALSDGFARITATHVIILAEAAEWPEEIEENRALEAKKRAEERLQSRLSEVEYVRSRIALQKALARLTVKSGK